MTQQPETHTGPVRRPLGELPVAVVLLIAGGGIAAIVLSHWRRGIFLIGLAALVAAVFRLVLHSRDAGLLVVRSRAFDVVALTFMGSAVMVLTHLVPAAGSG
ncbi:MAG: hypothetical protein QOE76_1876 [Frankiales bacterium]|nr:hypothetical protein [Frankiales bacterium]MDX6244153.1 hypothetical protein [Frankiales bacterium]